jgi:hypothetical protein
LDSADGGSVLNDLTGFESEVGADFLNAENMMLYNRCGTFI